MVSWISAVLREVDQVGLQSRTRALGGALAEAPWWGREELVGVGPWGQRLLQLRLVGLQAVLLGDLAQPILAIRRELLGEGPGCGTSPGLSSCTSSEAT